MNEHGHLRGMTLRYPATRWQDALPTGSGVVGALVYGSIQNDTILLNHDALYYPRPLPKAVDVSDQLPEVRRLIRLGRCREAAECMPAAYTERSGEPVGSTSTGRGPYQPFCAIQVAMSTDGPFRNYRRGLDFETGRVWVGWTDDRGSHTRDLFVSRVTDTVCLRIRCSQPGSVGCRVLLRQPRNEQGSEQSFSSTAPGDIRLTASQAVSAEKRTLTFCCRYPNGFAFGAWGQVHAAGGVIREVEGALVVEGANEVVMEVQLFLGEEPDAAVARLSAASRGGADGFDAAFAEHAALHGELFNRVTLSLAATSPLSNEEMLMAAYDGEVPVALVQRMFEFGRHLLICSSRPGGWPANLQGLWNGDYAPAWNADVHTDENIQMNYWQALPGGLPELLLPLFDYFEKHLPDFRKNARNILGCRGILVPIAMTTHGREIPCTWSNWTAGAGWIGQHFYDYSLFTGDLTFLRHRAVPWLKEVARFYEDFLTQDEEGRLLFIPSLSPENRPANGNSLLSINATMDIAVCREALSNLCAACKLLDIETAGVARWQEMLGRLPPYEANEDGAMKEWLHSDFRDNYHHRHQSHLYPVFPGLEITEETNPAIYKACVVAVEKRLVIGLTSQTGWSMAHMANIYGRLGCGERALECLELLTRSSTGPNLFTYHNDWRHMGLSCAWDRTPPFQIDANLGMAAAVLEMLVFSKPGLIRLLPALPSKWGAGCVKGIRCRGGVMVDIEWNRQTGFLGATLTSSLDQQLRLRLPAWAGQADVGPPESDRALDGDAGRVGRVLSLRQAVPLRLACGAGRTGRTR